MGVVPDLSTRFLHIAGAVWGFMWVLSIALMLGSEPTLVHWLPVASALLAADVAALAWLWRDPAARTGVVAIALGVGATANAFNVNQAAGPYAQVLAGTWLNVATIVIAFVTPGRKQSVRAVLFLVCASGVLLTWNGALQHTLYAARPRILLPVAYAIAVGMAAVEAATAVRGAAVGAARDSKATEERIRAEAAANTYRDEVRALARLLHDTVINTLGAIRRGVGADAVDTTRARCLANLRDLRAWLHGASSVPAANVAELLGGVAFDARLLGVEIDAESDGANFTLLPTAVAEGARIAIRELLTNVAKHARSTSAQVRIGLDRGELTVSVLDDGPGWDGVSTGAGGGFQHSVVEQCEALGGTVRVLQIAAGGTLIETRWPLQPASAPQGTDESADALPSDLSENNRYRIASRVARWMLGVGIFEAVLFFDGARPWGTFATLILLAIAVAWFHVSSRTELDDVSSIFMALAVASVIATPNLGLHTCRVDLAASFGVDAAAGLVVLLCMTGPRKTAPMWAAAGTIAGLVAPALLLGDHRTVCVQSVLAILPIELGTVLVATAFRRLLERLWSDTGRAHAERTTAARAVATARARDEARTGRLRDVLSAVEPLVEDIADGVVDPNAIEVRESSGRAETALRSLLNIDERLAGLGDILSNAVQRAYRQSVAVRVVAGEYMADPGGPICAQLAELLEHTIVELPAGASLDLGLFQRHDRSVLTLVVTGSRIADPHLTWQRDNLMITLHHMDAESLMEVSWQQ